MTGNMEEILRNSQLAFLGRLLSGFTHEIKNHLAIINESSGLMGDLLAMGKAKEEESQEKFQGIIRSIAERIDLANVLVKNLNSFAHRMDMPFSVFSVSEIVGEEIVLLRKFTRLKGVEVELELSEDLPSVQGNPALIQLLIYLFVNDVLGGSCKGGKIRLVSGKTEDFAFILLRKEGEAMQAAGCRSGPACDELFAYVVDKLGVKIVKDEPAKGDLKLILPFTT